MDLARQALELAVRGDLEQAAHVFKQLVDGCGVELVPSVMILWADIAFAASNKDRMPGSVVRPMFRNANTGEAITEDEVDPRLRWATMFMIAQANDDRANIAALLDVANESREKRIQSVWTLLRCCAWTINGNQAARR